MADPINYRKGGITHRTPRDRARAHGTKLPPLPQSSGYCGPHGMPHTNGTCKTNDVDAEAEAVSRSGGAEKAPVTIKPFKLGG